ncbi:MAG: enoyl-CoA hydratase [Natronospirillum sp.]
MISSKTDLLRYTQQGHIGTITFNNPPANTWTLESLRALELLVSELDAEGSVYALILQSDSEKFFSAGADLKLFADGDPKNAQEMADAFAAAFEALSAFRGVSIAAINGWAMGGGLEVALACDLRVAEAGVQMALPEASVGVLPCAGGTQNLTRLVGEGWAKRMILCNQRVSAEQALTIGLVEEVVAKGEAQATALGLAQQACQQSPKAVAACKQLIQHTRYGSHAEGLVMERELFVGLFGLHDQREGVQAFLEKRQPVWKNQ